MGLVAPGILIGLPGALMGARFIQSVLFGVSAADPLTFLEVSLALAVIVFVACLGPALQAAHGNPVEVMRAE